MAEDEPADRNGGGCFGVLDSTVGLNVTVRVGRGGACLPCVEPCDMDEISGVVSVEPDAMTGAAGRRRVLGVYGNCVKE